MSVKKQLQKQVRQVLRTPLKLSEQEMILALNLCANITCLEILLNDLQDTTMYRNGLRLRSNQLQKELDPYFNIAIKGLYDFAPEEIDIVVENVRHLTKALFSIPIEQWQFAATAATWCAKPDGLRFQQLKALCIAAQNDPVT